MDTPSAKPEASSSTTPAWAQPAAAAALTLTLIVTLVSMGQPWWCKCGSWNPVSLDTWSMHNSQHLFDAYTLSHVLHGFVFFGLLGLASRWLAVGWRFVVALLIEAGWEILENTPLIIDRYREATASLDYFGDSVLNSTSDLWSCAAGFWVASKLPWWGTVLLFVAIELVMLGWIRDNLTLNVLMLLYPIEGIKTWQAGAA